MTSDYLSWIEEHAFDIRRDPFDGMWGMLWEEKKYGYTWNTRGNTFEECVTNAINRDETQLVS